MINLILHILTILILAAIISALTVSVIKYRKRLYQATYKIKKSSIPVINLEELNPRFRQNEFGFTTDAEIHYISAGQKGIPGGVSDLETWVLSVLAKDADKMFEFGTCTGKTSYLWAKNSGTDAKVYTLTLPPEEITDYISANNDASDATQSAKEESLFSRFIYSGTNTESKISQIFCNSKKFDTSGLLKFFDFIFVDGSHAFSFVENDTQKSLEMIKDSGIVVWHDYRPIGHTMDVFNYLNGLNNVLNLKRIEGTSLVVYSPAWGKK